MTHERTTYLDGPHAMTTDLFSYHAPGIGFVGSVRTENGVLRHRKVILSYRLASTM